MGTRHPSKRHRSQKRDSNPRVGTPSSVPLWRPKGHEQRACGTPPDQHHKPTRHMNKPTMPELLVVILVSGLTPAAARRRLRNRIAACRDRMAADQRWLDALLAKLAEVEAVAAAEGQARVKKPERRAREAKPAASGPRATTEKPQPAFAHNPTKTMNAAPCREPALDNT